MINNMNVYTRWIPEQKVAQMFHRGKLLGVIMYEIEDEKVEWYFKPNHELVFQRKGIQAISEEMEDFLNFRRPKVEGKKNDN